MWLSSRRVVGSGQMLHLYPSKLVATILDSEDYFDDPHTNTQRIFEKKIPLERYVLHLSNCALIIEIEFVLDSVCLKSHISNISIFHNFWNMQTFLDPQDTAQVYYRYYI